MGDVVAVTGSTGFVGGRVARGLAAEGWRVRALTRRPDGLEETERMTPVFGSLSDPRSLDRLVEGVDAVVHCAGVIRGLSPASFDAVNVVGTESLADSLRRVAPNATFIYVSSLAARQASLSNYASSKLRAEQALARRSDRLRWRALRPPAVYGPGDREILSLFRQLRRGYAPMPWVDGARLSMIYVDDLTAAIAATLACEAENGAVFEVHDGREGGYTWSTMIDEAALALNTKVRHLRVPRTVMQVAAAANAVRSVATGRAPMITHGKVRELYHRDWVCRGNPLMEISDWRPEVTIGEGFRRTVTWYREQGWL
jgi:nucleoside-diphosphate-sugar epimerase